MVSKFLPTLSGFSRRILALFGRSSYLPERMELTNPWFPGVGLRIAF
jgi:hypothetical protein